MTQMMLFDAPADTNTLASTSTSVPVATSATVVPSLTSDSISTEKPAAGKSARRQPEYEQGLNRMGDLARLVILRYELAAKRRAEQAAQR